jgi:hypothetical protein
MAGSRARRSASVHVLVAGEAPEHGLAELSNQGVAAVLAGPGVGKDTPGELGQAEGIVQFPKGEQPGIGRDLGAVEFQLEPAIEPELDRGFSRFTRWMSHAGTTELTTTH